MTLLSLVHVENILFDATCGLLIIPRNEGIRYSGRVPEGEERKEPNSDDEELHGVAFVIFFSQMHVVLESIQQVVILSPRAGVFQPSGKVASRKADQTRPTRDQRYSSDDGRPRDDDYFSGYDRSSDYNRYSPDSKSLTAL